MSWATRKARVFTSRRALVLEAVILAIAVGAGVWWWSRPDSAQAQPITTTVTTGTIKETVSASGTITAAKEADLSFTVSGTVTAVPVSAGDKVTKGQVLARIDDSVLAAQVTAAQASVDAALTRLDDDEDDDASDAQLSSDRAQLVNAETELEQAKANRKAATLRSTITGTLAAVNVSKGDVVTGSSGTSSDSTDSSDSTAAFTVVSTGRFVVDAEVATSDIDGVKKGLQVEITATGSTSTDPVYGTVATVGRVATAQDSGAATFPVTIQVTGRRKDLYAGTSATVEIITKQVDDVLTVPTMALHQDGDETYVEKVVDGKTVKTVVKLGETYGQSTEVKSGLADGDVVELVSFQRSSGGQEQETQEGGPQGGAPEGGSGGFPAGGQQGSGQGAQ
ncbi:MAG: efflux RND transporter periplasmic adaptor subunit [Nocardioidaceae bacterium]